MIIFLEIGDIRSPAEGLLLMKMAFRSNLFFMTPIDAGLLALHMKAG
jgi:hypothetical protein